MKITYTRLYRKDCDSIMPRDLVEAVILEPDKKYSEQLDDQRLDWLSKRIADNDPPYYAWVSCRTRGEDTEVDVAFRISR